MIALCFDTETTGLIMNHTVKIERQPHVCEFYACRVDLATREVQDELDLLIKPPIPISAEITKITGLTSDMVSDSPNFAEVADQIRGIIERSPLVIAHNCSFDVEMIDIEFERLGQTPVCWPQKLCTVEQSLHLKGKYLTLGDLHLELTGMTFTGAHRAKVDVQALVRCAANMHERGML